MRSTVKDFFKNHPLTFLSCDPNQRHIENAPKTMTEARNYLLQSNYNFDTPELELGHKTIEQLYLFAIGEYNYLMEFENDPDKKISKLIKSKRISENSYGFLCEMDKNERKEEMKLKLRNLDYASYQKLLRFCFSHFSNFGCDISINELKDMANWIIKNESENLSFDNMTMMMQQAIDLSTLSQNVGLLNNGMNSKQEKEFTEESLKITNEMLNRQERSTKEVANLFSLTDSSIEAKFMADFQNKIMKAYSQKKNNDAQKNAIEERKQSNSQ